MIEVITEAVSSRVSAGTVALEDPEDDEESKPAAKAPWRSDEEGDEAGEDADEEEVEEEEGEVVEARTGAVSLGSKQGVTSGSSLALVEAGLGLGLGAGDGAGNGSGSEVGEAIGSVEALSSGSSTAQSVWSTTSPWTTVLLDMEESMETAATSNTAPVSPPSVDCRAGAALQRVRRALRRKSARVRLLILPSRLRRPTVRRLGAPAATTATSVSSTGPATSLASLMVSLRDSSRVKPDLWVHKVCVKSTTHWI